MTITKKDLTYTGAHQREKMRYKRTKDLGIKSSDITKKALQTSAPSPVIMFIEEIDVAGISLLSLNNNHAKIFFLNSIFTEFPLK